MANRDFFRRLGLGRRSRRRRRSPSSGSPRPCAACCWRSARIARAGRRPVRLHRGRPLRLDRQCLCPCRQAHGRDRRLGHRGRRRGAREPEGREGPGAVHASTRSRSASRSPAPRPISASVRNQLATLQATYRQKQAQIEQAKTDVAFYETGFQRQQDLLKRGVASQAAFDQAKRDLDAARERVVMAQHDAEATLAQLGGKADAPIEQNASYLARAGAGRQGQARPDAHHRAGADPGHRHQCRCAAGRRVPAGGAAGLQPGLAGRRLDRGQPQGDRPHLPEARRRRPSSPSTPIPAANGRRRSTSLSPATGAEFSVLPAQNATGNWVKVVQRVPVRLAVQMPADAPPLRTGMSATVEIDTGHRRRSATWSARQFVGM